MCWCSWGFWCFLLFAQPLSSLADSIFLVTSASSVVPVGTHCPLPFPHCQIKRSQIPRGTQITLWKQMFLIGTFLRKMITLRSTETRLSNILRVWDISLSCSVASKGWHTLKAIKDEWPGWHVYTHEIKYRDSGKVVELQTKSLKPALGAWSNIIQEITSIFFTVMAVCGTHVKSSAELASLSRRLCSAMADSGTISPFPYILKSGKSYTKWEISICNLWNVKLEKLLGNKAVVMLVLTVLSDALYPRWFSTIKIGLQRGF